MIGIVAGWLAGKIMRGRGFGLLMDLVIGIVGSLLGGAEHHPLRKIVRMV